MKSLTTPENKKYEKIDFTWIFPKKLKLENVTYYTHTLKNHVKNDIVIFDLTHTTEIHSSFIGFLIDAKSKIEKNGGSFKILVSENVEKILEMLNLSNHFKIN